MKFKAWMIPRNLNSKEHVSTSSYISIPKIPVNIGIDTAETLAGIPV